MASQRKSSGIDLHNTCTLDVAVSGRTPVWLRGLLLRLLAMSTLLAASPLSGQSKVQVSVSDGHTGKRITGARVSLIVVRKFRAVGLTAKPENDDYIVDMEQGDTFVLGSVTTSSRYPNEYELCASGDDAQPIYAVSLVVSKGISAPNNCGNISAVQIPGNIHFFVKHISAWTLFWSNFRAGFEN